MKDTIKTFVVLINILIVQSCSIKCNPLHIDTCQRNYDACSGYTSIPEYQYCGDKKKEVKNYMLPQCEYVVKEKRPSYDLPSMDLIYPDVHVETSTPSYQCTTQAYEVPRCRYCQSSPPSQMSPPQIPSQQMPCPYYPSYPLPAPAPSYCVQSVVVGGSKHDSEENGSKSSQYSKDNPRNGTRPERFGSASNPASIRGVGIGDNSLDSRGALDRSFDFGADRNVDPGDPRTSKRNNTTNDRDRYEKYIEKILDVMKDRLEPEPSPMVVVAEPACSCPEVRVKTLRRKKQKKYRLASCECEEPDPVVVVEEEEEPSYVVHARPSCSYRKCRSRCRCF